MRRAAAGVIVALAVALPASALKLQQGRRLPEPKRGGPSTTFLVRYESVGQEAFEGDYLYVRGPRRTACAGEVIAEAVGHEGGIQTIRMGPRVVEDDSEDFERRYFFRPTRADSEGRRRPLARWCRGVYRGWVQNEQESDPPQKHTRFRFAVR